MSTKCQNECEYKDKLFCTRRNNNKFPYATLKDMIGEEIKSEYSEFKFSFTDEEKQAEIYFWKCVEENKPFDFKWE